MNHIEPDPKAAPKKRLSQWLFNPFKFIAGYQALLMGLAAILLTSLIGSLSNTHFDGVLDVHTGLRAPLWFFVTEGLIDWICMVIPLFFFGLIVSHSSFRMRDVFGTQALARWPYLISAIAFILFAYASGGEDLTAKFMESGFSVIAAPALLLTLGLAIIVTILTVIWMVALMYRAYCVSCNIKGPKAIATFIASLIGAEVLSKFAILSLLVGSKLKDL
jgi:hypothetical protein